MKLNVSNRNGRVYLYIEKGYRDGNGNARNRSVKALGYVDELEKEHADPIAHYREVAKKMTEDENANRRVSVNIDMEEELPEGAVGARNLGYAALLKAYHELGLDKYLKNKARGAKFKFNTNSIMILLVISRILSPGSKLKAFNEKGRYFERFDFSYDDIIRALSHFDKISEGLQRYMYESVRARYGSDTSVIYYDVTNYYFEISKQDSLRKYSGNAKQKRKKPVAQMGLAMDKNGIPIHYEMFPGNKLDKETFRSVIGEVRKNYDTGRVVVVADMGVITGDNINYLVGDNQAAPKNGYVFSFSVRGGTKAFKKHVLDEKGYTEIDGGPLKENSDFKIKDRVIAREINVTMDGGKTRQRKVYEKQVVFWNYKYYIKARAERAEVLAKAEALIADPEKFNRATSYGAASYINNLAFDKDTGKVLDMGKRLSLDTEKIEEEEKYDGYYAIVTSELSMTAAEIVNTYRGLWEIEETFKITKSELEARPVYVSEAAHINGHFLTCFIALTILRIIQKLLRREYSPERIVSCLNKIECMNEHGNIWLFGYRSEASDAIGAIFGVDFSKKRLRLAEIKKILGDAKK